MEANLPSKLYKYQGYNAQTLDNLKNRCLWFSKPSRFNDPFDCSIPYCLGEKSNDEWDDLYQQVKKIWEDTKDIQNKEYLANLFQGNEPGEGFRSGYILGFYSGWRKLVEDSFNEKGIACFSEKMDDLLMWSHYADGHRGFCLEFDTRFTPFSTAKQVHYSELLPSLPSEDSSINLVESLALTKSAKWCYEKEWRVFNKDGDVGYGFTPVALTGIYLGSAMPDTHVEIISSVISDLPTINLYKMRRSLTEFKVDFEQLKNPYVRNKSTLG